jgi:hypothetical protein
VLRVKELQRDLPTVQVFDLTIQGLHICRSLLRAMRSNSAPLDKKNSRKMLRALQHVLDMLQDEVVRSEAQGEIRLEEGLAQDGMDVIADYPLLEMELRLSSPDLNQLELVQDGLLDFVYKIGQRLVSAPRWVETSNNGVQSAIFNVASTLKSLLELIRSNNELNSVKAIDPIERSQLIALLEAALFELKAPYIDRSRWSLVLRSIQRMLGKAVEGGVSSLVEDEFHQTLSAGESLSRMLERQEAQTDLPFL